MPKPKTKLTVDDLVIDDAVSETESVVSETEPVADTVAVAPPKPAVVVKQPIVRPCTASLPTLGRRVMMQMKEIEVPIQQLDGGRMMMARKEVWEEVEQIGGKLTFDEAWTLGTQTWKPYPDNQWTCSAGGRRFIVDDAVLEQIQEKEAEL